MRGVVRCDHCGAPHRREAASTRFRCDWCGGDNRVEVRRLVEELVLAADDHSRDPATRIHEALGRRGLVATALHPRTPRWVGVWQVVNEDGEAFNAPVRATVQHEPVIRTLPAGTLRGIEEGPPAWAGQLPARPELDEDSRTIVEAARADFDAQDAPVTLVRLVWIGVAEFVVNVGEDAFQVAQILGTDRVVFERAPAAPAPGPPVGERLFSWAVFLAGAVVLGVVVRDPGARLASEVGWLALGLFFWLLRRDVVGARA